MNLLTLIPAPYRWLALVVMAAALISFGWVKGVSHVQGKWDAERYRQAMLAAQIEQARAEATVKVVTKYVDRIKVVREQADVIIKEVPVYVNQESDNRCIIPRGFVLVHNAAAKNSVPQPARDTDADPAGITLSAVAGGVAGNYATCHEIAEQLTALQTWINEQREIGNE